MTDGNAMAKMIDALGPWHESVVLVGGWAHRLHRLHPGARVPKYAAVVTRDADLAFDTAKRIQGDIAAALQVAGFEKKPSGEHVPPVSHFQFGEEDEGFYVEFLTPLRGSSTHRDGTDKATASAAGVTAQKLRHLEVLLTAPWKIDLRPSEELPVTKASQLLVANPVSFIVQKLLIHHVMRESKKAQDMLYIHDTLELFRASLEELKLLWQEKVSPSLTDKVRAATLERAHQLFLAVSDPIRNAIRIPGDRRLDPDEFRQRCEVGLAELFAPPQV